MTKLLLIDAYAMIYRAYYAFIKSPRINSKGMNTSAVFGFVNTLNDVLAKEEPDYVGVAFDPHGGTFRTEIYPEYKAQREKTPEDITIAVPIIKDILKAMHIPVYEMAGYEADDVIGTLATQASQRSDVETLMMTLDKDYGQLVKDNVMMCRPQHSGKGFDHLGPQNICDKHGIDHPSQVIDMLGLMGDASDNVPGCPGIGPKTASQLIKQFGSVAELLKHTDDVASLSLRNKIEDNREGILLSTRLVTIDTDVPLTLNLDEMRRREPNSEALNRIFTELEFRGLAGRMLTQVSTPVIGTKKPSAKKKKVETNELSLFFDNEPVPNDNDNTKADATTELLAHCRRVDGTLIGYDLKRTIMEEARQHRKLEGPFFDIMIARYLLHSDMRTYDDGQYNATVKSELEEAMRRDGLYQLFTDVEMPLMSVLARMEHNGVLIDKEALGEASRTFTTKMEATEKEIFAIAGEQFNISSPKQVGEILFDKLHITDKAKKTKSGQYVTSEEVLQGLRQHDIVALILKYRGYHKLLSTYINALPKLTDDEGRLHTTFNQAVTATGRLSSSNPNLQNIPVRDDDGKEVRKAFIPDKGCKLLSADYSQIELRIMAHLSGDENMIAAFCTGADIHASTAAKVFRKPLEEVTPDERRKAKVANFGIIYGITTFGLAERMGVSRQEAKDLIEEYFNTYPDVKAYMEKSKEVVREYGYATTLFGRRCYLPDINSHNAVVRGYAERNAINAPIQGTAADIIKVAMVEIDRGMQKEGLKSKMLIQVHDELTFSVVPGEEERLQALVVNCMENACHLRVPLTVSVGWGENWLQAH